MLVSVAVALVTMATLLFEVTLTRVLSFSLWYHFAFLVVGVALLGTATAGSWLAVRRGGAEACSASRWALGLALLLPAAHALFQVIPFEPFRLAHEPGQWLLGAIGIAVLACPFFATGVVISSLLARAGERPFGIYAADLIGAGTGAALAPLAVRHAGAPGAIMLAASAAALAALLFSLGSASRRARVTFAVVTLLLLVSVPFGERLLPWRITGEKRVGPYAAEEVLRNQRVAVYHAWDMASRVDVLATAQGARILIDGGTAMTRVPQVPPALDALAPMEDLTAAALDGAHRVLVIGSGGGWEVLRALSHGATEIDAVEVNPLVVSWARRDQRFGAGRLHADPRVRLVLDEARAFLASHDRRYDAILMVHTISNAAYGAGAMSLAEDYLLTQEAITALLDHLSDDGLLLVTRPRAQLPRLARTVTAVLPAGASIDRHALAFHEPRDGGFTAGLVIGRRPIDAERRARAQGHLERAGLTLLSSAVVAPTSARALRSPATDDRPFFSQRVPFSQLRLDDFIGVLGGQAGARDATSAGRDSRMALEEQPVAEVAALGTGAIATCIGLLGILLPLLLARRTRRALAAQPGATVVRFGALGFAFLFVEIALMQKVTRIVGHPSLAFAVVLAAVLVGSGLGSQLLAPRIAMRARPVRTAMLIAAAVTGLAAVLGDPLLGLVEASPLGLRLLLAGALCAVIGLALGAPFPVALRQVAARGGSVPWAFGVNGFASVAAPALAVVLGAELGLTATILIGATLYALTGLLPDREALPSEP